MLVRLVTEYRSGVTTMTMVQQLIVACTCTIMAMVMAMCNNVNGMIMPTRSYDKHLTETVTKSQVHQTWRRLRQHPSLEFTSFVSSSTPMEHSQSLLAPLSSLSAQSLGSLTFLSNEAHHDAPHHTFTQVSCTTQCSHQSCIRPK
jgi:hypothetical protein